MIRMNPKVDGFIREVKYWKEEFEVLGSRHSLMELPIQWKDFYPCRSLIK